MKRRDSQPKDRDTDNRNTSTQDIDRDDDSDMIWIDENQTYGGAVSWMDK